MKNLLHIFHQIGSRFYLKSNKKPRIKAVDISKLPFMLDSQAIRVRCIEKKRVGSMLTAADYVIEVYKNGEWKIWPYVQSFTFELNVKDYVPKITVQFIDNVKNITI